MSQDGASINSTLNSGGLPPGSGEVGTKLADTTDADDLTPTATATATATEEEKQLTGTTQDGTLPLAQPTTASARTSGNVTPRSLEKNMAKAAAKAKKEAEAAATKSNDAMERLAERAATKAAEKTVDVMLPKIKEEVNQVIDTRFEEQEAKLDAKFEKRFAQQDAKLDSRGAALGYHPDPTLGSNVVSSETRDRLTQVTRGSTATTKARAITSGRRKTFKETTKDKELMKLADAKEKLHKNAPFHALADTPSAVRTLEEMEVNVEKYQTLMEEHVRDAVRKACNEGRVKLTIARQSIPALEVHLREDFPRMETIALSHLGWITAPALYDTLYELMMCETKQIDAD